MQNELNHIFQTYFSNKENPIHFYGEATRVIRICEFLRKLVPFDHPDAYAVFNDEVLIFEHFEFDSSTNNKKGSQQRRSESYDNKEYEKVVSTEEGTIHHGVLTADYSIKNYISNLKTVFCKHYNEIPAYKKTLQEKGIISDATKISTLFFIEDTTILGNIFETKENESGWMPVILPLCDFFIELFEESIDLDIVMCASWYPNEYCLWYLDRTMIQEFKKHGIDTSVIEIINFNPQSIGVKISIPDEKLRDYGKTKMEE